jgi:hypothetical protein
MTDERLNPSGETSLFTMGSVILTVAAKPWRATARRIEVVEMRNIMLRASGIRALGFVETQSTAGRDLQQKDALSEQKWLTRYIRNPTVPTDDAAPYGKPSSVERESFGNIKIAPAASDVPASGSRV